VSAGKWSQAGVASTRRADRVAILFFFFSITDPQDVPVMPRTPPRERTTPRKDKNADEGMRRYEQEGASGIVVEHTPSSTRREADE